MHSTMQEWATEVVPEARAAVVSLFAGALFLGSGLATALLGPLAAGERWGALFGAAVALVAVFGVVATAARAAYARRAPVAAAAGEAPVP